MIVTMLAKLGGMIVGFLAKLRGNDSSDYGLKNITLTIIMTNTIS